MIAGIVLAAGTSSRFGRTKQTVEVAGRPLVQHAVDALAAAGVDEIVVVLGHDAEAVRRALRLPPNGRAVLNPDFARGQSTSLAAGLRAASPTCAGAVVLLADQPGITASHVRTLVERFLAERPRIARLRFRDGPGPAVLGVEVWPQAMALAGDTGARELMARNPGWVLTVDVDEPAPPDVDRPEDLAPPAP
ncbi:MAG TPA: nucleotidyltransferase family protein [Actinomycetota bacterium]|nr:nucleotidyltransferase family protein [Actinomycetota bacterium]